MTRTVGIVTRTVGIAAVVLACAGSVLAQPGQRAGNPFAGDSAAIAEGRNLLAAVCGGYCHATLEGETTDAPDLFDCEWWHGDAADNDDDLFAVIRDGVPDTRMQGFGGILPDDDIWRLIAAIRAGSRCAGGGAADPAPAN